MLLRWKVLGAALGGALAFAGTAGASNYIILYKQNAVPADIASAVAKAGGTLVYSYNEIGVAVASSSNSAFRDNILTDSRVENASSTAGFATQLAPDQTSSSDAS